MNTTHHLASLFTMSPAEFSRYVEAVNMLAQVRKHVEADAPPTPQESLSPSELPLHPREQADLQTPLAGPRTSPIQNSATKRLATRPPMRAAKPGTLRGDIHELLRSSGKPLRRATIITAIASRRGRGIDDSLRGKISEILTNPHDPFVRRVAFGTYEFVAQEAPCL